MIHHQTPIPNRHRPLFLDFLQCQPNRLSESIVGRKRHFRFGVFTNFAIEIFDKFGCVNNRAYFDWKIKKGGQIVPVVVPALHCMAILRAPLLLEVSPCSLFTEVYMSFISAVDSSISFHTTHLHELCIWCTTQICVVDRGKTLLMVSVKPFRFHDCNENIFNFTSLEVC